MRHCSRPCGGRQPVTGTASSSTYVPKRWQKMITGDHDLHLDLATSALSVPTDVPCKLDTSEFDPRADICRQPAGSSTEH